MKRKAKPSTIATAKQPEFNGRIIGIDLGLANTAAAVIEGGIGDEHVLALEFCGTEKSRTLRQMNDDRRRLVLIEHWLERLLRQWRHPSLLTVIRYEWFAPRFNMTRGWTTSMVVGAVDAVAQAEAEREQLVSSIAKVEVLPASPPLHIQVSVMPKGWRVPARAVPHLLDALTHARLEWCRRAGV